MKPKKNRKNIRWRIWDYRWNAAYFITICTKNKAHYFGEIVNKKMVLSHVGVIANILWSEIKHHSENIILDAFVIMPNHIHGILIIDNPVGQRHAFVATSPTKKITQSPNKSRFQNQGKNSISSIIGSYKSAVTKHANRLDLEFGWQGRFHDHVIRDDQSFLFIQNYILQNPEKWENDCFHPGYVKP